MFTRILCSPKSVAICRVIPMIVVFTVSYAELLRAASRLEDMLMMAPPSGFLAVCGTRGRREGWPISRSGFGSPSPGRTYM